MTLIINNITELKEVVSVLPNFDFSKVKPAIKAAGYTYGKKLIGSLYTSLITGITDNNLTEDQQALRAYVADVIGNLAMWKSVRVLNLSFTSDGIHKWASEEKKTATGGDLTGLEDQLRDAGFAAIETLLEYLDENAETFSWHDNPAYQKLNKLFINRVEQFEEFVEISGSRYLLMKLSSHMRRAEQDSILPILGADAFSALKVKLQSADQLSPEETTWLPLIRAAVAYLATAQSVWDKVMLRDENGRYVLRITRSYSDKQQADATLAKELYEFWQAKGEAKLAQLDQLVNPPAEDETTDRPIWTPEEDDTIYYTG